MRSALARHESRGLHVSRDYPQMLPEARDTVLDPAEPRPQASPDASALRAAAGL